MSDDGLAHSCSARNASLAEYCIGLLLPGERKSVEPMAVRVAPAAVAAKHHSLHHFGANAFWDESELLAPVRSFVLPIAFELISTRHGPVRTARREKAGVSDDSAFEGNPTIALGQIEQAPADDVPRGIFPADAGYANDTAFPTGSDQVGPRLRRRRAGRDHSMSSRSRTAAEHEVVGYGASHNAASTRRDHETDIGQGARAELVENDTEDGRMA